MLVIENGTTVESRLEKVLLKTTMSTPVAKVQRHLQNYFCFFLEIHEKLRLHSTQRRGSELEIEEE